MKKKESLGSERWGTLANEEAAAAFSSDEEGEDVEEEGTEEAGGVHMLAADGSIRPGPT